MSTNSETYFFRDHGQFDLLRQSLLPELIERRRHTKTLRIWSAGCASGEEPYSLAILLDMLLPKPDGWSIQIIGSDVNSAALAKARQARYGPWSFRQAPAELRQRYFRQEGTEWQLQERIRRMVGFRAMNLIDDPFPDGDLQDMDLILCRNVFIYFDSDTIAVVANKLADSLSEGGYLMAAHAELSGVSMPHMHSRLLASSVVYQRLNAIAIKSLPVIVDTTPGLQPAPTFTMPVVSTPSTTTPAETDLTALLTNARSFADRGEYDQAEQSCRQVLMLAPLMASPHFLLAQVAQLRGDFQRAGELLQKTLYLDPDNTGAILELAALCERAKDLLRAQSLRRTALNIIRELPSETLIEPYEMTAAEIVQWLTQCTAA